MADEPMTVEALHKQMILYHQKTDERLDDGDLRMDDLRTSINDVKEDTSTLVEILEAAEGFFKFAKWIGVGLKWIAGIAASFGITWASITHINWK